MTRDECLKAISSAFGDVMTLSPSGTWQVIVETTPKREIILMPSFVARNIEGGAMSPAELEEHLRSIAADHWAKRPDGSMMLALN